MLRESVAECELARQIDPTTTGNGAVLNSYLYLGEYDKFLQSMPETNDSSFLLFYRGFAGYYQRNWTEAGRDFDHAYQLESTLYTQIGKAFSDAIAQRSAAGLEVLRGLEEKIQEHGGADPEATYKIAQGYTVLGDKTSGIRMLRYSVEHGFFPYPYFRTDPLLENIRNEPEFADLMETARVRYAAFRSKFFG